ncbi:MAG: succinate dehydrogenase, partial [Candidatus Tectimicrobiota bacterium]
MGKSTEVATHQGLGATMRRDTWWREPALVAVGLGIFGLYATWAALQGKHYFADPYLSPFYSPLLLLDWWPWSPAILILWAPLGFRVTCYYYRKAYYRAYFLDPPACAVGEFHKRRYCGETTFPLLLQNLHRYFLYAATVILAFLWYDVVMAFNFDGHFGVGVGTLVLFANSALLTMYTLSCHSVRHFFGGRLNCFATCSASETRHKVWSQLSSF